MWHWQRLFVCEFGARNRCAYRLSGCRVKLLGFVGSQCSIEDCIVGKLALHRSKLVRASTEEKLLAIIGCHLNIGFQVRDRFAIEQELDMILLANRDHVIPCVGINAGTTNRNLITIVAIEPKQFTGHLRVIRSTDSEMIARCSRVLVWPA